MVQNIQRTLKPSSSRSFFLFGPRQAGKSTFVKSLLGEEDLYINLLPQRTYLDYIRDPNLFRQEVLAHKRNHEKFTCVVDEIQKIPTLLDEIHDLIESEHIRFILTGSSARKLKRGAANLLAGRASNYHLYPCTFEELEGRFDLDKALTLGSLPYLWSNPLSERDQKEFLEAYAEVYLREEIQAEGLVRNIAPFVKFIDVAAYNSGEIVNYSNIARECAVTVKTVQEYYQILEDTFIAHKIDPWVKSVRKRLNAHPKYYLFDTGITNALCRQYGILSPEIRGRRFEQFLILNLIALNEYHRLGFEFFFWRTQTGQEIDLILARNNEPVAALEIKSNTLIKNKNSYALREFKIEYPKTKTYILCPVERARMLEEEVLVMPWPDFLKKELLNL